MRVAMRRPTSSLRARMARRLRRTSVLCVVLLGLPMAIPAPAMAGCGFMSFACDAASDVAGGVSNAASSVWNGGTGLVSDGWNGFTNFGDWVMGPVDEMLGGDGIMSARYEDANEWDSAYVDGDALRNTLFDFQRQFLDCVSNFEPTGAMSLSLMLSDTASGELSETGAAAYGAAQADDQVQSFVRRNPELVSRHLPRAGRAVPVVGRAIALINIKMAYDSCERLVNFTPDEPESNPQPPSSSTTTTTTTQPTPTTRPSPTPPANVPGGRAR